MTEPTDALYVYGVTAKSGYKPVSTQGVEGAQVQTVEHAGLVALASPLANGTLAARDLRAHWRVLEHVCESGTILPMRFGTVMKNERAIRSRLLEPNAEQLSGLLEQMAGMVQLNVKGRYNEELLLREIVRSSPAIAQRRERLASRGANASPAEQIALGQMIEREVARYRAMDEAMAHEALQPFAAAARAEEVSHPSAFNLAFLVKRQDIDAFGSAVGEVRERFGDRIEVRYVGPVPPFSFAEADLNLAN